MTSAGVAGADVTTFTNSVQGIVDGTVLFHPCGNDGVGEDVVLFGFVHFVVHFTLPADFSGNFVVTSNWNSVIAIGVDSGNVYRTVGGNRFVTVFDPGDVIAVDSFSGITQFIGEKSGPRFRAQTTTHITFNTAGVVTVSIDFTRIVCE